MLYSLLVLTVFFFATTARAAEVMPTAPAEYVNDYAHVLTPGVASRLNQQLEQFEKDTSNQVVVAIYPKMQSDSDIADYTVRVAQSWRVGQKIKKNGVVLFIFTQDRKLFIQVGYGLEGALPDATCKKIIDLEITPRFKAGDYDGGVVAGVNAIIAATKGEYKGAGKTAHDAKGNNSSSIFSACFWLFLIGIFVLSISFRRRGYGGLWGGGMMYGGGFGGGGFGGRGGGGGGGGFSGGGGSFGGGGAGGSW